MPTQTLNYLISRHPEKIKNLEDQKYYKNQKSGKQKDRSGDNMT